MDGCVKTHNTLNKLIGRYLSGANCTRATRTYYIVLVNGFKSCDKYGKMAPKKAAAHTHVRNYCHFCHSIAAKANSIIQFGCILFFFASATLKLP